MTPRKTSSPADPISQPLRDRSLDEVREIIDQFDAGLELVDPEDPGPTPTPHEALKLRERVADALGEIDEFEHGYTSEGHHVVHVALEGDDERQTVLVGPETVRTLDEVHEAVDAMEAPEPETAEASQASAVAGVFDDWADRGRDEGMAERHGASAERVLEALDLDRDTVFLDLGAGNAWAAAYARREGAPSLAVDVAPRMLARARDREGPVPELALAAFEALPIADDRVHVAFSMEALYYADDLEATLAEIERVLAPGGQLHLLVDYYEENPESEDWPEKTGVEMHRLSEDEWAFAVEDAGLVDVTTERVRAEDAEGWRAEHGSLYVRGTVPQN